MEQARWPEIENLLQEALDVDPRERMAFLRRACGEDEELRREVEALIACESDGELLETPALAAFMSHRPSVSLVGQQVGRYRIEEEIGTGGMAEVYRARDEALQRTVALKALSAEFTADPDRVRRFEQEAFAASRLNHPNIVTIFEMVQSSDLHLIATEYIEGQTLRQMLTDPRTGQSRALPVAVAVDIAIQVAAALKAAHTAWIIHRDMKPENVMVRADGLVKVLDFGIAKLTEAPGGGPAHSDLTPPGSILGTASYMSPEQAAGAPLDGRTDLFSLGLVLFEMTTGQKFRANVTLDAVPHVLQRVVRRLLRSKREERYGSASELLEDLGAIKRRLETRSPRRMLVTIAAVLALAAAAAFLSVKDEWEERVLRDGHSGAARRAVFSPDGRLLVSCGDDGQVIVWDFGRRERLATLAQSAHTVAFAPDGRRFVTGGTDGAIVIWDAATRRKLRAVQAERSEIRALAFSPDGALLAAATRSRTTVWETTGWSVLRQWDRGVRDGDLAFSTDTTQLLASSTGTIFDLAHGLWFADRRLQSNALALSPAGDRLATLNAMGVAAFYRLPAKGVLTGAELMATRRQHQDHGRAIVFSPDGRLAASAAGDIVLWDAEAQRKLARLESSAIVWGLAFSPDGRWLVSTHADGAILIWDVAERERVANLQGHNGAVRTVAAAPDGRHVASAGDDRAVIVWDLESGRKQHVFARHQTRITTLAFSNDGKQLRSVDQDGVAIVWNLGNQPPRLDSLRMQTRVSGEHDGSVHVYTRRRSLWGFRLP